MEKRKPCACMIVLSASSSEQGIPDHSISRRAFWIAADMECSTAGRDHYQTLQNRDMRRVKKISQGNKKVEWIKSTRERQKTSPGLTKKKQIWSNNKWPWPFVVLSTISQNHQTSSKQNFHKKKKLKISNLMLFVRNFFSIPWILAGPHIFFFNSHFSISRLFFETFKICLKSTTVAHSRLFTQQAVLITTAAGHLCKAKSAAV